MGLENYGHFCAYGKFILQFCFVFGATAPSGPGHPHSRGF